jgi:hypothetical protein
MIAVSTTRQLLLAIAEALPEEGHDLVTRLEIWEGWGSVVHVRVHTGLPRSVGQRPLTEIKGAIESSLGSQRHRVEIAWSCAGQ